MKDNSVLIFKAISDDLGEKDPYINVLSGRGFNVQTIPVLQFKFRNLIVLKEKLDCPSRFGGRPVNFKLSAMLIICYIK